MKKTLASIAAILFLIIIVMLGLEALKNPGLNSFASVVTKVPTDFSAPKNYYKTERPVPFAIISQKNTGVPELNRFNLQTATISLFQNLQSDQNYQTIIVLLDPSYPVNESDLFEQQARFAFPNAKYFSILPIKDQTETALYQKLQQLSADNSTNPESTLIIAQTYLNFSDYDSELEALQKSHYKNAFDNLSKHSIDNLAFTNQAGLKAVYQIAKDHGDLKALPTIEDNTHQFQIKYLVEGAAFQTNIATITFFGDIMLGRQVRQRMEAAGDLNYPFALMDRSYLQMNDLLVANLEGPIVNKVIKTSKTIAFHFFPDVAPILKNNFFDALSAANNHTIDMGQQGFQDNYQILRDNGLAPFGNPRGLADESVSTFDLNGQKIALIGLNNTDFKFIKADVVKKITELNESGYKVIPFIHWGVEYKHTPSVEQKDFAHAFVDAGAYAIIGMHPHVVETFEIYNDRPIFYSLGNAIFDQDFSPDTMEGLSTTFRISEEQLEIYFVPIKIDKSQFHIMDSDRKNAFLKRLTSWGSYDQIIKDQIEKGKIVIKTSNI